MDGAEAKVRSSRSKARTSGLSYGVMIHHYKRILTDENCVVWKNHVHVSYRNNCVWWENWYRPVLQQLQKGRRKHSRADGA